MIDVKWHERAMARHTTASHREQHRNPSAAYWCGGSEPFWVLWVLYGSQQSPAFRPMSKAGGSSPFELINYARAKLMDIRSLADNWDDSGGKRVSTDALIAMDEALRKVVDRSTVFPFLSPNGEGGVLAEWHAERQKVELEVDADGTAWAYATDPEGKELVDERFSPEASKLLRNILRTLSERVDEKNPRWRELFSR